MERVSFAHLLMAPNNMHDILAAVEEAGATTVETGTLKCRGELEKRRLESCCCCLISESCRDLALWSQRVHGGNTDARPPDRKEGEGRGGHQN